MKGGKWSMNLWLHTAVSVVDVSWYTTWINQSGSNPESAMGNETPLMEATSTIERQNQDDIDTQWLYELWLNDQELSSSEKLLEIVAKHWFQSKDHRDYRSDKPWDGIVGPDRSEAGGWDEPSILPGLRAGPLTRHVRRWSSVNGGRDLQLERL